MPPAAPAASEFAALAALYARAWWDNTAATPEAVCPAHLRGPDRDRALQHLHEQRGRWAKELERVPILFGQARREGRRLSIEAVLNTVCRDGPQEKRRRLFRELLIREIKLRQRAGEHPEPQEYRTRRKEFADFGEAEFHAEIETAFEHVNRAFAWRFRVVTGDDGAETVLGEGGQAVVVLGYDDQLDREVAIKRVEGGEDAVKRLRREAKTLARLADTGVPVVYGVGNDETGRLCLAEHLLRGPADPDAPDRIGGATQFSERINEFHSYWGEAHRRNPEFLDLIAKLIGFCRTVGAAHRHPFVILHRDLNPKNLVLDHNNQPFVIDWGLAVWTRQDEVRQACEPPVADEMTSVSRGGGTPGYRSREQARAEPTELTPACDVFGLGGCLFQALTRLRVYDCVTPWWRLGGTAVRRVEGDGAADELERRAREYARAPNPAAVNRRADRELCDIARRAIDPRPENRFRDAGELAEALEDWIRDNPPRHPSGGWLRRRRYGFGRSVRRHTGTFVLVTLVLALVGAVVGAGLYVRG